MQDEQEKVKKENQSDSSSDSDESTDGGATHKKKDHEHKSQKPKEFNEDIFKKTRWDDESDMEDLLELEKIELEKRKKL